MDLNHSTSRGHPNQDVEPPWFLAAGTLILILLLVLLFRNSFAAQFTLFSSDGPLGLINAQANKPLSGFTGYWQPLNWVGFQGPSSPPSFSQLQFLALGPILFSKFYAPISLLFLGLSVWFCFRRLGFPHAVAFLGALGATLNMNVFSNACWGLPTRALTLGCCFLAIAAIQDLRGKRRWIGLLLAGFAVGMGIMESFDIGAIFSLYIAGFALFHAWNENRDETRARRLLRGSLRVTIIAIAAAWISVHALATLVSTQIQGIAGMQQDETTRVQRWDAATMWSLPKMESLRVGIPGLYGYRLDTPDGGAYWGAVGQQPGWPERHQGLARHSGSGEYAGVLVLLIALWGIARSISKNNPIYGDVERRWIWFWSGLALVSLLLAFGRHAPFYQLVYALPYASTIRNPIKFMHPFHLCLLMLFGYGLCGLWRGLNRRAEEAREDSLKKQLHAWWKAATGFDRKWTTGMGAALIAAALGGLIYASSKAELVAHLQTIGFPDPARAQAMAAFSVREVLWFVLFLLLSILWMVAVLSGVLGGKRLRWAVGLAATLLIVDLARANAPWIVYYDYLQKYATNPIVDFLKDLDEPQRVTGRLGPSSPMQLVNDQGAMFGQVYSAEWLQHLFQYHRIQSLDIVQMPRTPRLDEAYILAFVPAGDDQLFRVGRLWELTNTRYIIGMAGYLDFINQNLDPQGQRFRVQSRFSIVPKPGYSIEPGSNLPEPTLPEHITCITDTNGAFALFEFRGALPRAGLYSQWEVIADRTVTTNGATLTDYSPALERLTDPAFDPANNLVLNESPTLQLPPTNTSPGTVRIETYEPRRVVLEAQVTSPSVLLLNDRWHPHWHARVDGEPARMLRANHLMRAVELEPGTHQVEFEFTPPAASLGISLTAVLAGVVLCGLLAWGARPGRAEAEARSQAPASSQGQPPAKA